MPKRVLIIKLSSMGDIIHTLPAITDAKKHYPDIKFDWLVEEGFAQIPAFHSAVNRVITVALRRWRKKWYCWNSWCELFTAISSLRRSKYDLIIDAQSLLKSAIFTKLSQGVVAGFDKSSARESIASCFYRQVMRCDKNQHAILRIRQLFSHTLGYTLNAATTDYSIAQNFNQHKLMKKNTVMFLHGTSRVEKEWKLKNWKELALQLIAKGQRIILPWGDAREFERAEQIAKISPSIEVLPKMTLAECAQQLLAVQCVVAVDTGLAHLAAALDCNAIVLYGSTNADLIGTVGKNQQHLQAADINNITVDEVYSKL